VNISQPKLRSEKFNEDDDYDYDDDKGNGELLLLVILNSTF